MRYMVDSTNVADDPAGAQMVAYYIDGIYATTEARVRVRFPNAVLVPISAIGSNAGIVGDVEPGCMTVAGGVIWVLMRRRAGVDPTLYVNEMNTWGPARQAFINQGIPEPHWWVADYDGIAVVPAGAVAKQYANPTLTGGHFDKSVVADFWPGVDGTFGPGGGSLGGIPLTQQEHDWLEALVSVFGGVSQNQMAALISVFGGEGPNSMLANFTALGGKLDALKADLDALKTASPSAEPKTITGTITGTLS